MTKYYVKEEDGTNTEFIITDLETFFVQMLCQNGERKFIYDSNPDECKHLLIDYNKYDTNSIFLRWVLLIVFGKSLYNDASGFEIIIDGVCI
jgi:hypothetical protein